MIRILNIVFILFITSSFSQENEDNFYLYYFGNSAGDQLTSVSNVASVNYGIYSLKLDGSDALRISVGDNIIVDKMGVAIEKNRFIIMPREEVRENSKYIVRDNYLHGVLENDSVLVGSDTSNYFFLLPVKNYLYEVGKQNKIFQGLKSGEYLVLSPEDNGYWSALYVVFNDNEIELKEVSFENDCTFENIENKSELDGEHITYILNPTKAEWNKLFGCFITYDKYGRVFE